MTNTDRPRYLLGLGLTTLALLLAGRAHAETAARAAPVKPAAAMTEPAHGPSSAAFPSHHFQWAPHSPERVQLGVNFGLVQLAMHGFNVAAELRYKRLWLEYSHGEALTLNHIPTSLSRAESDQHLDLYVPYTTGFGVGFTVLDELWVGLEFKGHRYEVSNNAGFDVKYNTYSIGPVVGYKLFIWRGLYTDVYARYWPNVASTLANGERTYSRSGQTFSHDAHDWGVFANASLGWAFDL